MSLDIDFYLMVYPAFVWVKCSLPLQGKLNSYFPPLQGEGQGGDGVKVLRELEAVKERIWMELQKPNEPHPPLNLPLEGGEV